MHACCGSVHFLSKCNVLMLHNCTWFSLLHLKCTLSKINVPKGGFRNDAVEETFGVSQRTFQCTVLHFYVKNFII